MKKLFYILLFSLFSISAYVQPITWQRYYSGPDNVADESYKICRSNGDNYFIIGHTVLLPNSQVIFVIKINSYGQPLWSKTMFPGSKAYTGTSSGDGGCVISGSNDTTFALKLDSNGNVVWYKTYYDSTFQLSHTLDIIKTIDGGYLGCGRILYDYGFIFKIDSVGNHQWQRFYSANKSKLFTSIIEIPSGYIITGYQHEIFGDPGKGTITQIDNNGTIIWEKLYHIENNGIHINSIFKINGDGYKFFGDVYDTVSQTNNFCSMDIDTAGNILDTLLITPPPNGFYDVLNASMLNNNRFVVSSIIDGVSVIDTSVTELRIIDNSGITLYQNQFIPGNYSYVESILPVENGDILFAGYAGIFGQQRSDVYAIRTDSMLNAPPVGIISQNSEIPKNYVLYQNYPNPFNPTTVINYELRNKDHIKLVVYDISGKEVMLLVNGEQQAGKHSYIFNGAGLPSGIYFYSLFTDGILINSKKMLLIK